MTASTGEDVVVLIAGADPMADAVCLALGARGADVQQLSAALAVEVIASTVPDAVLLVGDAAKQRGALIRSQLVRRMRGAEINMAVLVDGPVTLSPNNALRLLSRHAGPEAIADQLMELAGKAAASRSKGTLDQVATMVSAALARPSEPAPAPNVVPATPPSRIVMTASAGPPAPHARQTLRVGGAIPAPSKGVSATSAAPTQLSLAPPISLQALATRPIAITKVSNPPPLPESTEVSLADVRIETDRHSGEVTISRAPVPPLPAATDRAHPTPAAWSTEAFESDRNEPPAPRRRFSSRRVAMAAAIAASVGVVAWASTRVEQQDAPVAEASDTHTMLAANPVAAVVPVAPATSAASSSLEHSHRALAPAADDGAAPSDDTVALAIGEEDDPVGDEPHLIRARQLCNEGHALRLRGRLGLAEAKYLQALGLFPQYPRAVAGVVRVHLTRGDGAEAVRWAERLVVMQANRSNNQLLLGDAYALSGKQSEARRHWRKSAAFGNSTARKRLNDEDAVLAKPRR